jgi:putative addiction module killer protein|tara:strand:+ start:2765 stop:3118 length:354 start_codon:yes stop_codon:yes gene_type:complete
LKGYELIVQEYICEDGSCPFRSWFDGLDPQASAKVATAILRLELGNVSNVKWIGGGLGEYRIDWGPGYRLYLTKDGDELVILFVGGTKKRQQSDIDQAGVLLNEYKVRRATGKKGRN